MFVNVKCPVCGWDEFTIKDYNDDFDDEGGIQNWSCVCPNGHKFNILRSFKCVGIEVQQEEEEEEEEE